MAQEFETAVQRPKPGILKSAPMLRPRTFTSEITDDLLLDLTNRWRLMAQSDPDPSLLQYAQQKNLLYEFRKPTAADPLFAAASLAGTRIEINRDELQTTANRVLRELKTLAHKAALKSGSPESVSRDDFLEVLAQESRPVQSHEVRHKLDRSELETMFGGARLALPFVEMEQSAGYQHIRMAFGMKDSPVKGYVYSWNRKAPPADFIGSSLSENLQTAVRFGPGVVDQAIEKNHKDLYSLQREDGGYLAMMLGKDRAAMVQRVKDLEGAGRRTAAEQQELEEDKLEIPALANTIKILNDPAQSKRLRDYYAGRQSEFAQFHAKELFPLAKKEMERRFSSKNPNDFYEGMRMLISNPPSLTSGMEASYREVSRSMLPGLLLRAKDLSRCSVELMKILVESEKMAGGDPRKALAPLFAKGAQYYKAKYADTTLPAEQKAEVYDRMVFFITSEAASGSTRRP